MATAAYEALLKTFGGLFSNGAAQPSRRVFPTNHPPVKNADGGSSNVMLAGVNLDGLEYVIPTMVDGKQLSLDDAVGVARKYGLQNYPSFKSPAEATQFAEKYHGAIDKNGYLIEPNTQSTSDIPNQNTRQANIAKAKLPGGDFEAKRQKYNSDAAAMGSPTYMDADGNITERKLNPADILQMTAQMSGGNTVSSRPEVAQRLLAMNIQNAGRARAGREAVDIAKADQQAMADINSPVQRLTKNLGAVNGKYGSATGFSGTPAEVEAYNKAIGRKDYGAILAEMRKAQAEKEMAGQLSDADLATMAAGGNVQLPSASTTPAINASLQAAWAAEQAAKQASQPVAQVAAAQTTPAKATTPAAVTQPAVPVLSPADIAEREQSRANTFSINDTPSAFAQRLREAMIKGAPSKAATQTGGEEALRQIFLRRPFVGGV